MFEPLIKTVPDETVAYLEMRGPYAQIPEGYGLLYGWVAQHGLSPQGMPEAVYLTAPDEVPEEQALWELWAPVAGASDDQPADETGCGVKHTGERMVAYAMHKGPYEQLGEVYEPLVQWLTGSGLRDRRAAGRGLLLGSGPSAARGVPHRGALPRRRQVASASFRRDEGYSAVSVAAPIAIEETAANTAAAAR